MYERAGYSDKIKASKPDRTYEHELHDTVDEYNGTYLANKNIVRKIDDKYPSNSDKRVREDAILHATISKKFANKNSIKPKNTALHDRINKRAEQKKVMGESVEDHINYVNTILELLD